MVRGGGGGGGDGRGEVGGMRDLFQGRGSEEQR